MAARRQAPSLFAVVCSVEGCGWKVLFPVTAHLACVARRLTRLGWQNDPDGPGFICHNHGDTEARADA